MRYTVTTTRNNEYHCGCHQQTWDDEQLFETLDEALSEFPSMGYAPSDNFTSITIRDNDTREDLAEASATWYKSASGYCDACHYRGKHPEDGAFDLVFVGGEMMPSGEFFAERRKAQQAAQLAQAERELRQAQANLEAARKEMQEG
jgi:hypothetical protein